jgi:hypothetical protein
MTRAFVATLILPLMATVLDADDLRPDAARKATADTVFTNGRIYTVNARAPLAEAVAVDVRQRDGLDDPDAARLGHRGHELGVAAGVHGAADERHLDAGGPGEGGGGAHSLGERYV